MTTNRAVIFDLFGTLVPKWSGSLAAARNAAIAEELGVTPEAFDYAWRPTFSDRECGRLSSMAEAVRSMLPHLGVEASEAQLEAVNRRNRALHQERIVPRDDVEPTIEVLAERGFRLGLLSNISAPGPDVFRSLSIAKRFRSLLFSNEFGAEKPDPALYARSIAELGIPAERCLFVGDGGSRELSAARSAGMSAVLIRVDAEIEEEGWLEDAAEWNGPAISSIAQLLALLDD